MWMKNNHFTLQLLEHQRSLYKQRTGPDNLQISCGTKKRSNKTPIHMKSFGSTVCWYTYELLKRVETGLRFTSQGRMKSNIWCRCIGALTDTNIWSHSALVKAGFTHADIGSRLKIFKISSKIQAKIGPKSVTSSQTFQNRIEAIFCLRLLGAFQKSADKVGVCKSG